MIYMFAITIITALLIGLNIGMMKINKEDFQRHLDDLRRKSERTT